MHIDLVIGNPPYQSSHGSQSIYHYFVDSAMQLRPEHIVMITKGNWLANSTTFGTFRDNMIRFGLKSIIYYPVVAEVFPGMRINTTIIQLRNRHLELDRCNIQFNEIRHGQLIYSREFEVELGHPIIGDEIGGEVVNKVINNKEFIRYDLIRSCRVFNIGSNGNIMGDPVSNKLFFRTNPDGLDNAIGVAFLATDKNAVIKYIELNELPSDTGLKEVYKYKVVAGSKIGCDPRVITNLRIFNPGIVLTNSWVVIALVDTLEEAENIVKYVSTKFFRFLCRQAVEGHRVTFSIERARFIPLLDFCNTRKDSINWGLSIQEIDIELYKKYGLSDDEINYIENMLDYIQKVVE